MWLLDHLCYRGTVDKISYQYAQKIFAILYYFECKIELEIVIISMLTVVERKDYHFLAVATISNLQNSYWNQWPHPYEPQISSRFVFSAVCLHFTAILVKFSEKQVL